MALMPPQTSSIGTSLLLLAAGTSFGILLDRYLLKKHDIDINDPAQFESFLRRYYNDDNNDHEPCPLDVTPTNIYHYHQGSIAILLTNLKHTLPEHIYSYISKLLLARGVYKAYAMRNELINYKKVLVHYQQRYEGMEKSLRRMLAVFHRDELLLDDANDNDDATNNDDGTANRKEDIQTSIRLHRQLSTIRGCLLIIRDVRRWTKNICCIPRWYDVQDHNDIAADDTTDAATMMESTHNRLFVAGDTAIYKIPQGFGIHELWRGFCLTEKEYMMKFREKLSKYQYNWPPHSNDCKNNSTCSLCELSVGKAWMARNSICWRCADRIKRDHRCPYEKGHPYYLCLHDLSCFSCEGHSCWECRIVRGDGGTVLEMMELGMIQPQQEAQKDNDGRLSAPSDEFIPYTHLFMDFDQTLSSSKSGGIPRIDRHGCNPQLLRILRQSVEDENVPEVHIITRQNHNRVEQILNYLRAFGVELPKEKLHCLGGTAETKAERIQSVLMERQCLNSYSLFVDDNPAEVCHEGIRKLENVVSVLFISKDFSCRIN